MANEYRVYHEADFCCLDHDDLLWMGDSEKEMDKFIDEWCERKAASMTPRNSDFWEQAKQIARTQLSIRKKEIIRSGGKILESVNLKKGDFQDVMLAITALKTVFGSYGFYTTENLEFEIHECEEDFKVRKVALSCHFVEYSDGSEERDHYTIDLYGYK